MKTIVSLLAAVCLISSCSTPKPELTKGEVQDMVNKAVSDSQKSKAKASTTTGSRQAVASAASSAPEKESDRAAVSRERRSAGLSELSAEDSPERLEPVRTEIIINK